MAEELHVDATLTVQTAADYHAIVFLRQYWWHLVTAMALLWLATGVLPYEVRVWPRLVLDRAARLLRPRQDAVVGELDPARIQQLGERRESARAAQQERHDELAQEARGRARARAADKAAKAQAEMDRIRPRPWGRKLGNSSSS